MYTLSWMVVGLIHSGCVSVRAWLPYVQSRARYAQSVQRRFTRWLHNERVQIEPFYEPLIQRALAEWGKLRRPAMHHQALESANCADIATTGGLVG